VRSPRITSTFRCSPTNLRLVAGAHRYRNLGLSFMDLQRATSA
jgi:hypothetical protein